MYKLVTRLEPLFILCQCYITLVVTLIGHWLSIFFFLLKPDVLFAANILQLLVIRWLYVIRKLTEWGSGCTWLLLKLNVSRTCKLCSKTCWNSFRVCGVGHKLILVCPLSVRVVISRSCRAHCKCEETGCGSSSCLGVSDQKWLATLFSVNSDWVMLASAWNSLQCCSLQVKFMEGA